MQIVQLILGLILAPIALAAIILAVVLPAALASVIWLMLVYVLGVSDPLGYVTFTPTGPSFNQMSLGAIVAFFAIGYGVVGAIRYGGWVPAVLIGLVCADIFAVYILTVAFGPIARILFVLSIVGGAVAVWRWANGGSSSRALVRRE